MGKNIARCLWGMLERVTWHPVSWGSTQLLSISAVAMLFSLPYMMSEETRFNLLLSIRYSDDEVLLREAACMARNMIYEAGAEPEIGKVAVGHVVLNRMRSALFPDTACEVIHQGSEDLHQCQFSWWCDGKAEMSLEEALQYGKERELALCILQRTCWKEDPTNLGVYYYAAVLDEDPEKRPEVFRNFNPPQWRWQKVFTVRIGGHKFYRERDLTQLARK